MIDISAIQALEIMQNARSSKSKKSLFGLLNHTVTPMGARMLRSNVLQPSTQLETIIHPRNEALEELTQNEEMFRGIRKGSSLVLHPYISILTHTSIEGISRRRKTVDEGSSA